TAIRDLLAGAARRGITIVMTSHTLPVIEKLAADVLMMRHGRIVWRSSSGAIPAAGSLEDLYFELVESAPVENLAWLGSSPS
ncbi:MAG TPA: hypothetical protein VG672_02690, partial [Bryobacteraceae bacterium]|nr:hypothetical protein [Bryobacteraceae bacterium]